MSYHDPNQPVEHSFLKVFSMLIADAHYQDYELVPPPFAAIQTFLLANVKS